MEKKRIRIILLMLVLILLLSGCKKPNLGVIGNGDNTMTINAQNAGKGFAGGAGFLTVEEGQKIVVDSSLNNKGEILLKFSGGPADDIDADSAELIGSVSGNNAVLEVSVKGPGTTEHEISAGNYGIYAEVINKANGTINISVK